MASSCRAGGAAGVGRTAAGRKEFISVLKWAAAAGGHCPGHRHAQPNRAEAVQQFASSVWVEQLLASVCAEALTGLALLVVSHNCCKRSLAGVQLAPTHLGVEVSSSDDQVAQPRGVYAV